MGGVYRKLISVFCLYSFESWRKGGSRSALGLGFGREREREGTRIRQNSVRIKGKREKVQKRRQSTVHSLHCCGSVVGGERGSWRGSKARPFLALLILTLRHFHQQCHDRSDIKKSEQKKERKELVLACSSWLPASCYTTCGSINETWKLLCILLFSLIHLLQSMIRVCVLPASCYTCM